MKELKLHVRVNNTKGITLVALVISIIVLLILATVSISLVINNGILDKAKYAVDKYSDGEIEEQIKLAYQEWQMAQFTGTTENANDFIMNRLNSTIGNVEEVLVENGKVSVTVKENEQEYSYKYDGSTGATNKSYKDYIGYYADVDADGTVDGIIFADLLVGNTKGTQWGNTYGTYTIPTINKDSLKNYYVSKENHEGTFGTKDVLSPQNGTGGKDRFYIMSLKNFTASSYASFYWYKNASSNMSDYNTATSGNFGSGKKNTEDMIERWNKGLVSSGGYGEQDDRDIWKYLDVSVSNGWFLPSRGEWAAFANELGITKDNYSSQYKLGNDYWSSSQGNNGGSYDFIAALGYLQARAVTYSYLVRLATTF